MKKAYITSIYCLFLFSINVCAQVVPKQMQYNNVTHATKWVSRDYMPGNIQAFEENKGQFPASAKGWKILYGCNYNGVEIFLADKGIIYNIAKGTLDGEDLGKKALEFDHDTSQKIKIKYQHIFIGWENVSGNSQIEAKEETPYSFGEGVLGQPKESIEGIKGFQKIIYHDLYPGVDLEFSFHQGKGIKYAVKVKPGFDGGVFKMKYSGTSGLSLDDSNNLHIGSIMGDIIDHAPVVSSGGTEIPSSFQMEGKDEIGFKFNIANHKKDLLIDPWTVFPVTIATYACDIGMDAANNTYVLEYSYLSHLLMYEQKYNAAGGLVWTYTLNEFTATPFNPIEVDSANCQPIAFSDFVTDANGNSYIANSFGFYNPYSSSANTWGMVCLNNLGQRNYLNYSYSADSIYETWNVAYSCADSILVEASCYVCCDESQFDGVNIATGNPNPGEYVNTNIGEIYAGTIAPNGNYYAMSSTNNAAQPDQLLCCNVTKTSATLLWQISITYTSYDAMFKETLAQVGSNGIAAGCGYLYTSDGLVLDQRSLTNGSIIKTINIPGGNNTASNCNSGIAVDLVCGNVYVGSNNVIYIYDQNLNQIGSFTGLPGKVFDVRYKDGLISACGDNGSNQGFVEQFNAIQCSSGLTIAHTDAGCSTNIGTATANATFCSGPYYYSWSPGGQTTQTITGLSAGIYTVTVTPFGTCFSTSDTVTVGGTSASINFTDVKCNRDSSGTATVTMSGGIPPFTYLWSNGATNQSDTGLAVGTYSVTVTDSVGCIVHDSVVISQGQPPALTIVPAYDSICANSSLILTVSGASTYSWAPNTGLSCYTCPSPTASPTATITYTVTGTDSSTGCIGTQTATIKVLPSPTPIITGHDSVCAGSSDTLTVTGGNTYTWSTGATTSSIIKVISTTQTITVTASNGVCTSDTNIVIHVVSPAAAIVPSKDSTCSGDTVKLTGSGGNSYRWSNSSTSSVIIVSPTVPTTYTLYAAYGTCRDSATITIGIIKPLAVNISSNPDSVCPGVPVMISVNISQGSGTYSWSTGATVSSISVTDTSSTTYSVTVYGKCDTVHLTKTVKIVPLPKPVITGSPDKCKGYKDTLYVSGGTTYKWNNGTTKTSYVTGAINADSTFTVIAYNSLGCADTTHYNIGISPSPTVSVSQTNGCLNSLVVVKANASGNGPFSYSWSPGGQTSDSIIVPDTNKNYTVTVSNGCISSKSIVLTPDIPVIGACCDKLILLGDDTIIVANGANSYQWSPAVKCLNPPLCDSVEVTPTVTTTYTVTGTDSLGCQSERIITTTVETPCFNFIVPNVFTPDYSGTVGANGGYNNVFYIQTDNVNGWSIYIYDRWGKEMFKSSNPLEYWNGNTESGGKAPDGVYYYIITATCQNTSYKKDGFLQLIR